MITFTNVFQMKMEEFKEIYERIKFLRHKGVKMKEIAEHTGFSPSVLSALFTTVLPAYFKNIDKGMKEEDALDSALVWVNNVSKKKLLGSVADMKSALFAMETAPKQNSGVAGNPYISMIENLLKSAVGQVADFSGIYMSYSISSSSDAMKQEPYLITPADNGSYVEVVHNSVYGSTHRGVVMMNGFNHIYLMFNENKQPQLTLFNICLKIPMFVRPPFLRGLYTCFDYNYNPIARRILFVKLSDSVSREDFLKHKGCLKAYSELDDTEKLYYDYTCGKEDVIRMCNIPSPKMNEEDLVMEKKLLSL